MACEICGRTYQCVGEYVQGQCGRKHPGGTSILHPGQSYLIVNNTVRRISRNGISASRLGSSWEPWISHLCVLALRGSSTVFPQMRLRCFESGIGLGASLNLGGAWPCSLFCRSLIVLQANLPWGVSYDNTGPVHEFTTTHGLRGQSGQYPVLLSARRSTRLYSLVVLPVLNF